MGNRPTLDDLKTSAAKKKAAKKKASKKKAPKKRLSREKPAPAGRKLAATIKQAEMARFVRAFAQSGWDKWEAVYQLHPELSKAEAKHLADHYIAHELFQVEMAVFMNSVVDRIRIDQDQAEEILSHQTQTSILDFLTDEGEFKSVASLRALPRHKQLALKKIKVTNHVTVMKNGDRFETQTIEAETYDIQKSIAILAKLKGWGYDDDDDQVSWADMLKRAERRIKERAIDVTDFQEVRREH